MSKIFVLLLLLLTFAIKDISSSIISEENVLDMRRFCFPTFSRTLYLPSYSGKINAYVIYLSATTAGAGCNLNFYASSNDFGLIFVMEFPKIFHCAKQQIILQDDSISDRDICAKISSNSIYAHERIAQNISIFFNASQLGNFSDFNLVVSSTTRLSQQFSSCEDMGKISCEINENRICVDENMECDGHPNCGKRRQFDEDIRLCKVAQKNIWYIVLCSVSLLAFSLYLMYRMIGNLLLPVERKFFILEARKNTLKIESQKKPPQVPTFCDNFDGPFNAPSSSIEQFEKQSSIEVKAEGLVTDSFQSSTDWNLSSPTSIEVQPRKVKRKKWPDFSKSEIPQYEKQLSEKMKSKILTSASEDDKPKITFYAATTKLS